VLATHGASDGALARIRVPGGRLRPDQLAVVAEVAQRHGDGHLELTSRGNLQLRGLGDPDAAAHEILAAGLGSDGPSDTIRNILASPLAGRIGGHGQVETTVAELDRRLRDGEVAGLTGRFLFGIDDGRGDILTHRPDVALVWRSDDSAVLVVGGRSAGTLPRGRAVDAVLAVAADFAANRGTAWRIGELDAAAAARLHARHSTASPPADTPPATESAPLVGWLPQDDGSVTLGAVTPAGRLSARTATFLSAVDAPIIITPHREILLVDLTEAVADTVLRVLAPMGLIFDAASPWARVSCCAGSPGCAKSLTDVRADAASHVEAQSAGAGLREHWVGCSRGCGSPTVPHVRVEAQPDGSYRRTRVG